MTTTIAFKSPLHEMACTTVTDYWNDSCAIDELTYAIERGAVGATSNPTIVLAVLKKEMSRWKPRILQIIAENPTWREDQIAWQVVEEMAAQASRLLLPVFERENGRKGRLSLQTNPANYRNASAIVEQGEHFHTLAPNLQIKIPVTAAGIDAVEEATARGMTVTATVCFTVPQALAVAEAVERGLARRRAAGQDDNLFPACAIMIGRLDDWMGVLVQRDNITVHPAAIPWAGVAVMKKAYQIYRERGYRTRLLAAAYRHHLHWSELIGGEVSLTIPYEWQRRFNESDVAVRARMDDSVDAALLADLVDHIPDFRRAYDEDGLSIAEFDGYGATARTLRSFTTAYHDLVALIREEFLLPNPDARAK